MIITATKQLNTTNLMRSIFRQEVRQAGKDHRSYFCAFIALFCVSYFLFSFDSPVRAAPKTLNKNAVETLFQNKLDNIRNLIARQDIEGIKTATRNLTHENTIVLIEFNLKMPNQPALPQQRAYFNRDPFIELFVNAHLLDVESFEMAYNLEQFQPQYGGSSAILHDSGTASGRMTEPFSSDLYQFSMTQKCRNTISADAAQMFKVDSIYCRMDIEYEPVHKTVVPMDGAAAPATGAKSLEKPKIADIISDLESAKEEQK